MLKKVLFSLTLASIVGSASAQSLLGKRVTRFNTKKVEVTADAKRLNQIVSRDGLTTATVSAPVKKAPMGIARAAATPTTWFQYSYSDDEGSLYISSNTKLANYFSDYGAVGSDNYNMAIRVPATYAGAVIDSVCNMFYATSAISNCRVWIQNVTLNSSGSLSIPTSADNAAYSMAVSNSDIKGLTAKGYLQMSKFKLDKTFTVGENGCLIGFQFTASADSLCAVFGGDSENGGWYHQFDFPSDEDESKTEPEWANMYGLANLPIGAHMDMTNCVSSNVDVNGVVETTGIADSTNYVGVNVTNNGWKDVTSLSYILSVNGAAEAEQTLTATASQGALVEGGATTTVYVPVKFPAGENFISVELTKIDGEANQATTPSSEGTILGLTKVADRVSVVEEGTSTSCGYCPRGTVGLEKVKEALGDKVVALSVHGKQSSNYDDPMTCSDYAYFLDYYISSYPSAIINRVESADPYAGFYDNYEVDATGEVSKIKFGLDKAVTTVDALYPSEGSVAMTAKLSTEEKKVTVNTSTTFNVDRETAPYSLLFVLTEDGMTGTDNGTNLWSQYNYYSQSFINTYYNYYGQDVSTAFTDTDMDTYKNGAYKYAETYNNVVVGAWSGTVTQNGKEYPSYGLYGVAAFEDQDIVAGEAKAYDTTLDLSSNTMIQNYNNLKLAVLLLNDNNGMIVNAAQVKLVDPAGIEGAVKDNNNSAVVARYSIDGRKLDAPVKGLNIVKTADGRSMKVLVK